MRDENALATVLLTSRLVVGDERPLSAAEFWRICDQVGAPSALLGRSEADLVSGQGLPADMSARIVALVGRATGMAFEVERYEQSGIRVLTPFDADYPAVLRTGLAAKAPPLLYAAGAVELCSERGLGVVGSRDVSPEGAEAAQAAAQRAARLGLVLVSGGARGVDQLAMNAAMEAGGGVIGIVADSLSKTLKNRDVRRAIHSETIALYTPFNPDAPFSVGNAMARNKLIYAQSRFTLVVASDEDRGGTWAGATEALKNGIGEVAVWRGPGEGAGNAAIEERGAVPVSSVDQLEDLLAGERPAAVSQPAEQQVLFGSRA